MSGGPHLVGENLVDSSLTLHRIHAFERLCHTDDAIVPAPGGRTGVSRVGSALIDDVELDRIERTAQLVLDQRSGVHVAYDVAG